MNPPPKAPHTPPKVAPIAKPAREATGTASGPAKEPTIYFRFLFTYFYSNSLILVRIRLLIHFNSLSHITYERCLLFQ